jgi:hypothetical protein
MSDHMIYAFHLTLEKKRDTLLECRDKTRMQRSFDRLGSKTFATCETTPRYPKRTRLISAALASSMVLTLAEMVNSQSWRLQAIWVTS